LDTNVTPPNSTIKTIAAIVVAWMLTGLSLYMNVVVRMIPDRPGSPLFRPLAPLPTTLTCLLWCGWLAAWCAPRWQALGSIQRVLVIMAIACAMLSGALFYVGPN
jgi:hypothetical protein